MSLGRGSAGGGRSSLEPVSPLVALVVGLLLGGAVAATVLLGYRRDFGTGGAQPGPEVSGETPLARRLLDLMDPAVVVIDTDDSVLVANPAARALGIVRGTRLLVPDLLDVAREVRREGSRRTDVRLPGDRVGAGP